MIKEGGTTIQGGFDRLQQDHKFNVTKYIPSRVSNIFHSGPPQIVSRFVVNDIFYNEKNGNQSMMNEYFCHERNGKGNYLNKTNEDTNLLIRHYGKHIEYKSCD